MFSTFKSRIVLGVYIFLILSIPVGAYLASQNQTIKSSASETKLTSPITKTTPPPTTTKSARDLFDLTKVKSPSPTPATQSTPEPSTPTIANAFGPTLSLSVNIEGRKNDQSTKLFVGILQGPIVSNPKFLLTFSVDVPASGQVGNLSLAGLTSGTQYTALIKGSAQIATSSAFMMAPSVTNLNSGQPLNLITGDLNDDNTINSADYSIAQKALGSTATSSNWNANADFNLDGIINAFDLSFIIKNLGLIGDSGTWVSPIPQVASPSASLNNPQPMGAAGGQAGYWIWVPK